MEKTNKFEVTSMMLHILAMIFMMCDHLWATIIPGNEWLTCIGRLALPIFAFLLVEGYFHTSNLKKYIQRLFIFAIISEIPFNLAVGSSVSYIVHQNILWSFLIGIGLIHLNEKAKKNGKVFVRILTGFGTIVLGFILGLITFVDFNYAGIFTILTFYFFRGRKWWNYLFQFLILLYINNEMIGGLGYEISFRERTYFIHRQAFALLALIPIWLYKGKQGYNSKALQYSYYAFYPLHLLILGLLKML